MQDSHRYELSLLGLLACVFVWSAVYPADRFTWWLEVFPVIVGIIVLAGTYRQFRFSVFTYSFIVLHMIVLLVGGHYTYAEVPLCNWLKEHFDLARNHYDRLGHFAQGFVPALIAREILVRNSPLGPGKLLGFLVICICLAISAFYELFETGVSIAVGSAHGESVTAFLGTQGDVWDTQWDMTFALVGACIANFLLSGLQDRAILKLRAWQEPSK
jgi:putative membrane protein